MDGVILLTQCPITSYTNFTYKFTLEKKVTYLCVVRLLLDSTTALEGLFGEYHSSSAALGKRRLGVTKQPPFGDWGGSSNTRTSLMFKTSLRSNAEERSVAGV